MCKYPIVTIELHVIYSHCIPNCSWFNLSFQRLVDVTGGNKLFTNCRMKLRCMAAPKVLCLDEPTNFLDFETAPWQLLVIWRWEQSLVDVTAFGSWFR